MVSYDVVLQRSVQRDENLNKSLLGCVDMKDKNFCNMYASFECIKAPHVINVVLSFSF